MTDPAAALERLLSAVLARRGVLGDDTPSPLTLTQGLALGLLVDGGPHRPAELARAIGTTGATATRTVDALVERGLAERRPDPDDGRCVLALATERGRAFAADRRRAFAAMLDGLLADLDPADAERARELLGELGRLVPAPSPVRARVAS